MSLLYNVSVLALLFLFLYSVQAYYRDRDEEEPAFVFPYNLGRWENFKLVFHFRPRPQLTGLWWPVIDGCNQYTLTVSSGTQQKFPKSGEMCSVILSHSGQRKFPLPGVGIKLFYYSVSYWPVEIHVHVCYLVKPSSVMFYYAVLKTSIQILVSSPTYFWEMQTWQCTCRVFLYHVFLPVVSVICVCC